MNIYEKEGRYNGETKDCVVIAISNAFNISYETAHKHCEQRGRKFNKGMSTMHALDLSRVQNKLRSEHYGYECILNERPGMTLRTFLQNYNIGTYIIRTGGHASVVRDSKSYNNPQKTSIISYFIKIKKMTTQEMRSYAASQGIKVIGLTNDQLKLKINLPEVGEIVKVSKTKKDEPIDVTYRGYFKCKKTNIFYAKLQSEDKKKFIKQLSKIQRNAN